MKTSAFSSLNLKESNIEKQYEPFDDEIEENDEIIDDIMTEG